MRIHYPFGRLMRNGMLFCSIFLSPLATKLFLDLAPGDDSSKTKLKLAKTSIIDLDFVGYNQWLYVMRNNGSLFYDSPDADGNGTNAGGEFPRGSAHYAVFAAGLHVGTKKNGIPVVSETEYSTEFQPGRITNSNVAFSSLTAEDPSSSERQVYLIDQTLSGSDYTNWPIDAPRNPLGNPSVIGLARTWVVFNDLDISRSQEDQTVSPDPGLGLQIEESSYAFGGPALQNCVLVRFRITNKTNTSYDSTYFGFWSDPDLGNATNDLVGTDTSRGMAYCYNSASEGVFNRAVGYRLLYCTDAGGINARLVSSTSYINGTDPNDNKERLFMLRGETTSGGNRANGKFDFPGDPVTSSGVLDPAGADKRVLLSVGPIQLTPGSSQDLVFAIIGGQSDTPLNAILNLRAVSDSIKTAFTDSIQNQLAMAGELLSEFNVPDANFRAKLSSTYGITFAGSNITNPATAAAITFLDVSSSNIADLTGIEAFTGLDTLYCYNNQLTSLDVSANTGLTNLRCASNQLTSLDLSANTALTILHSYNNQLTSLDFSANTVLTDLQCDGNQLTSLDLSANTALTNLSCGSNQITSLDLSANTALTNLYCYFNQLTSLNVSANAALTQLVCYGNQLPSLVLSANTALTLLHCYDNQLTSLDVSANTVLTDLQCNGNQLTSLDASSNTALTNLSCGSNQLTSLDVSANTGLIDLQCDGNQLTSLDVSVNTALGHLDCYNNQLTFLDVSANTALNMMDCKSNRIPIVLTDGSVGILEKDMITQVAIRRSLDLSPSVGSSETGGYVLDTSGAIIHVAANSGSASTITTLIRSNPSTFGSLPQGVGALLDDRYWTISNATFTGTYNLILDTRSLSGIVDFNGLNVLKRSDSTAAWQNASTISGVTVAYLEPWVLVNGLTSFSDFALANANQPPVRVTALGDTTLNQNFPRTFIAYLPAVFSDPDDSVLTYSDSALSSGVSADVTNDSLYVTSTTGFLGEVLIRVSATDGGATTADTFRVTVIDNVAPVLSHGILASEVVDRVRIVVTANEAINTPTVSVNSQSVTMTKTGDAYFNNYTLNSTGDISLNISITDLSGNPASDSPTYHVTLLSKRTSFGRFAFTSASQAGYLILSDRVIEHVPAGWTPLGQAVGMTVTSRTSIQASSSYEAIPDVDEHKIGIYEWTGEAWTYAGGQGRDGQVSTAISGLYPLAVFYNPNHVVLPERFALLANFPNPFNPVTSIGYELPTTTNVILKVYNILGQEVRTLVRGVESAGFKQVQWDGRDASGRSAASGIYIYRIEAGSFVQSRKMLLIK